MPTARAYLQDGRARGQPCQPPDRTAAFLTSENTAHTKLYTIMTSAQRGRDMGNLDIHDDNDPGGADWCGDSITGALAHVQGGSSNVRAASAHPRNVANSRVVSAHLSSKQALAPARGLVLGRPRTGEGESGKARGGGKVLTSKQRPVSSSRLLENVMRVGDERGVCWGIVTAAFELRQL